MRFYGSKKQLHSPYTICEHHSNLFLFSLLRGHLLVCWKNGFNWTEDALSDFLPQGSFDLQDLHKVLWETTEQNELWLCYFSSFVSIGYNWVVPDWLCLRWMEWGFFFTAGILLSQQSCVGGKKKKKKKRLSLQNPQRKAGEYVSPQ